MSANEAFPISPARVRYIKLGHAGSWERECLDKGILRFGFDTEDPRTFALCRSAQWEALAASWRDGERSEGTVTRFTNETRIYFEDPGDILWVTFIGERFCWGFLTEEDPTPHPDGHGTFRRVRGGWKCTDASGEELTKSKLSGAITKLAAYRGTTCKVDVADKVVDRINGKKSDEIELAIERLTGLQASLVPLLRMLGPKDFEVLVDLIFAASGWRRLGAVGSTQKGLDIDLELPTTGERAFVQVKCRTSQREFDGYVDEMEQSGLASFSAPITLTSSGAPLILPVQRMCLQDVFWNGGAVP